MAYKSFEELPVWNAAIDLAVRTFALTATGALGRYAGLKNQIERAVVSISNNIAEGYERGSRDERVNFLYYALGSTGEVRSMLLLLDRLPETNHRAIQPHLDDLLVMTRDVARQLNAWIESAKNSQNRGGRFENDMTRKAREDRLRRDAFKQSLIRIIEEGKTRPKPKADEGTSGAEPQD